MKETFQMMKYKAIEFAKEHPVAVLIVSVAVVIGIISVVFPTY